MKNLYTNIELLNLQIGDEVLISFKDFNTGDEYNLEKSNVILIDNQLIYFENDYGTWDFELSNNSNKCYENNDEYEISIYKI